MVKPAVSGSATLVPPPHMVGAPGFTHACTLARVLVHMGMGWAVQPRTMPTFHLGRLVHLLSSGVSIRALTQLFYGSFSALSSFFRRRVLPTLPSTGLEVVLFLVFFGVITVYMQTHQSLPLTTSHHFLPSTGT